MVCCTIRICEASLRNGSSCVSSAQRVGFFSIGSGIEQNTGLRVGFGSGKSVEKYDRVFPGIFFSFRYFRVFRVYPGMSGIFGFTHIY